LSKVTLPDKTAIRKFDYILCIHCFSATSFSVNFFEGQTHLHFTMVES